MDFYENEFAMGGPCDLGFGKRLQTVRERAIRDYFLEKLPSSIDVDNVTCSGFTDSTVVASLRVSYGEAERLAAELEAAFLSPQNHPLFDVRTVSVSIPKDRNAPSTVSFDGGNF